MKIAFYKATRPGLAGVFNIAVRWWTGGLYSHCEAVLATDTRGYSLCASSSNTDGGVRLKWMKLEADKWDFVTVDADVMKVQEWFHKHKGAKYDTLGLFGFVGPRGTQSQKRWFCSEAVAASLGYKEPWRYDPNTLHASLSKKELV